MDLDKKGQGLIPALLLIFGSIVFVSAQVANSTEIVNQSIEISLEAVNNSVENIQIQNETQSLPQENTTPQATILEDKDSIITDNEEKLNEETENYFKNVQNLAEEKGFIIRFNKSIDHLKLANVTLEEEIDRFNIVKIEGNASEVLDLIKDNDIELVELEQETEILGDTVPINIQKVKADSAWDTANGTGVKVAILDTGISQHNDLRVAGGVAIVGSDYFDAHGHGTAVAGVVSAQINDEGLIGVAPDVDLYSVRIMEGASGELSNAIAGVEWAIDNNMNIILMSFGLTSYSQIFKNVLQEAYDSGILLVAASGNNGQNNILYPARYSTVIAVGALDNDNNLASFSSYGFEQELVAPGVDINSTSLINLYSVSSGTSLAAPHVAGVAALIKSFNNSLTNEQIRAKLKNDALDLGTAGKDDFYGYGLVQVKLNTTNYTFVNLSYFYEIFNISDFGLPNVAYNFWTGGNGTIDSVNFMPGYYLVNLTFNTGLRKSNIYNVSENGSIFILSSQVIYDDFFATDGGTFTDGIAWINDNITIKISSNTLSTIEVECFTVGPGQQFNTFDYCFGDTQAHMDECDSGDPDILCDSTHTQCSVVGTTGQPREIISYNFAHTNNSYGRAYGDCTSPGSTQETTGSLPYYIVEKKAARCINSSHYNISGWYGDNWIKIAQSTCGVGYQCVDSANFTSESDYINPCLSVNTCTGTIQIITEDRNGNPLSSLLVSRDYISNKTTNLVGVAEYNLSKDCGQNMEFKTYCSNSSSAQLCGSKTAKLDIINDYEGLLFDCSICSRNPDMQIDVDNVNVVKTSNQVNVNISLAGNITGSNINITFKVQDDTGLIAREASQLFTINSGDTFKSITQSITLNPNDDFVHVYIDPNNKVAESDEKNNYALAPLFEKQIKVYFDVNTGYTSVNNEIKKYLKLFVNEEAIQSNADVTLCIGRKCSNFNSLNSYTLSSAKKQKFGIDKNRLLFGGSSLGSGKPYNAVVGGFRRTSDNLNYIIAYGNDIDGDIAAIKKLISARDLFLNPALLSEERTKIIEDFDVTGISVADLLRNPSNKPYYNQRNSESFANVVRRILNNNNFEIAIKTVKSYNDNTTLRLKNINSDFSANFTDAVIGNKRPVVLARGLWSNLFTWNEFGKKLAFDKDYARDTWLIEITGGPDQDDKSTSPNYRYIDLVDYYWPALITGVQNYSGQKTLDYVGFSNGCRVGLDSIKNWTNGKNNSGYIFDSTTGLYAPSNLGSNAVNTFIGVGCPGAFQGTSAFSDVFGDHGQAVLNFFQGNNINHITMRGLGLRLREECGTIDRLLNLKCSRVVESLLDEDESRISRNLGSDYLDFIIQTNDNQPGNGLNIPELLIVYGEHPSSFEDDSDGIVTRQDAEGILNIVNATIENIELVDSVAHNQLVEDLRTEDLIRRYLR